MAGVTKCLLERLAPLLAASKGVVILDKVARGGGRTRWLFCRTLPEVELVLPQLEAGSRVGLFFDERVCRVQFSERVRQAISRRGTNGGARWCSADVGLATQISMWPFFGPSEIAEHLPTCPRAKSSTTAYSGSSR